MLERILVGCDGSAPSRHACEVATEIAARFGAQLTLAVVRPPHGPGVDEILEGLVPVEGDGRSLSTLLDEAVRSAVARGAAHVEKVFLWGDVLASLLEWVEEHPQDLIVVGSRGLSLGGRLLLGSVSSGLVNGAPCPVLVVRGGRPPAAVRGSSGAKPGTVVGGLSGPPTAGGKGRGGGGPPRRSGAGASERSI